MDSGPLDNEGPSLKEVHTFDLSVTPYAETGFEFLGQAIGKMLESKSPSAGKDMHPGFTWHEFPCLQIGFQSCQFRVHSFSPFLGMRTIDGLTVGGAISSIGRRLGGKDMWLNL